MSSLKGPVASPPDPPEEELVLIPARAGRWYLVIGDGWRLVLDGWWLEFALGGWSFYLVFRGWCLDLDRTPDECRRTS